MNPLTFLGGLSNAIKGYIAGALLAVILILGAGLFITRHTLGNRTKDLALCNALRQQLASDVTAKTAEAKAADIEHKAQVETAQNTKTQESDNALRTQLADARTRADDLSRRLRNASAQADSGGSGTKDLPRPANAASGANGAGQATVVAADNIACAENTVKAQGWQDWWHAVADVAR